MQTNARCPDARTLEAALLGALDDSEISAVEQHLLDCEPCAQTTLNLAADGTLVAAMRGVAKGTKPVVSDNSAIEGTLNGEPVPLPERVSQLIQKLRDLPTRELSDADNATVLSGEAGSEAMPEIDWSPSFTPAEAADEIGRLSGFRILKLLGQGGMGGVFLAEDMHLQRRVALKVMRPEFAARPGATERFLREARAVAAVHNEHIVTIYQVGQATVPGQKQSVPFLAQELLQGEPLDVRLKRDGQLQISEAVSIAKQMAEGLAAAHERGLIHRDIKPANVFLVQHPPRNPPRQQGSHEDIEPKSSTRGEGANALADAAGYEWERAKLLDFGLARSLGNTENLTQSGMILGTPAYMAPEQARGELVDARADLFSLGCVLYRMLTGQSAYGGKDVMAILMALATHEPPSPQSLRADVPSELSDLVMRLLAKHRDARPASARDVVRQLAEIETNLVTRRVSKGVKDSDPTHFLSDSAGDVRSDSLADAAGYDLGRDTRGTGRSAYPTKRLAMALASIAFIALLAVVIVKIKTRDGKETEVAINVPGEVDSAAVSVRKEDSKAATSKRPVLTEPSPFDALDPAAIPAAERFDWQPKELVAVLGSHRQRSWATEGVQVVLSGDAKVAFWNGVHGEGTVHNLETGMQETVPTPPLLYAVAISSDGTMLFLHLLQKDREFELLVRDGNSWKSRPMPLPVGSKEGLTQPNDTTFSVDGRRVAASVLHDVVEGQPQSTTHLWDVTVDPPKRILGLKGFSHPKFSSDGQWLAVISVEDRSVQVFNINEDTVRHHATVPGLELPMPQSHFGFTAGGNLAAIDKSVVLSIWDVSKADPQKLIERDLKPVWQSSQEIGLCLSRNGVDRLVISSPFLMQVWKHNIDTLELESEKTVFTHGGDDFWINSQLQSACVSDNGRVIASAHRNGMVRLWELTDDGLRETRPLRRQPCTGGNGSGIFVSTDGKHVLTNSEAGFQTWRVAGPTCRQLERANQIGQELGPIGFTSPSQFTTGGFPNHEWRIEADRIVLMHPLPDQITPLITIPAGLILSRDDATTMSLWQTDKSPGRRTRAWSATTPGHELYAVHSRNAFATSDDGLRIVTSDTSPDTGNRPVIRVWERSDDAAEPTEIASIRDTGQIHQLTLSSDGQLLAIAAQDALSLWGISQNRAKLLWKKGGIHGSVSISRDGRHVATSTFATGVVKSYGTLTVFDMQGDSEYHRTFPPYGVRNLVFAPDSRHLLTANSNGTAYILRLRNLEGQTNAK